jgi:hypothetical protein
MIRTVMMPAPALSFVVMGDSVSAGFVLAVEPALGSLFDVAPELRVRGAILSVIKFAPTTERAHI